MPSGLQNNILGLKLEEAVSAVFQQRGMEARNRYHMKSEQGCNLLGGKSVASCMVYSCDLFPEGLFIHATGQTDRGSGYLKTPSLILAIGRCWKVPSLFVFECDQPEGEKCRRWGREEIAREGWPHFFGVFNIQELEEALDKLIESGAFGIRSREDSPILSGKILGNAVPQPVSQGVLAL